MCPYKKLDTLRKGVQFGPRQAARCPAPRRASFDQPSSSRRHARHLRRSHGRRRRRPAGRRGPGVRADRPERRRQDLDGRCADRLHAAGGRDGRVSTVATSRRPAPVPARAARPREDVPVGRAVRRPHRRREPARRQRARQRSLGAARSVPARTGRPTERASTGRSRCADWTTSSTATRREISLGQRKLVGVGRALARQPRLVLLDEPAAGLDTDESLELGRRLRSMPAEHGVTVFLIDHDMGLVLSVCDYLMVLDFGRRSPTERPAEIREDPSVIEAYLGSHHAAATATSQTAQADALSLNGVCSGYSGPGRARPVAAGRRRRGRGAARPERRRQDDDARDDRGAEPAARGRDHGCSDEQVGGDARPRPGARAALALVPEGRALFPGLTVREHLRLAGAKRGGREQRAARDAARAAQMPQPQGRACCPAASSRCSRSGERSSPSRGCCSSTR